MAVVSYSGKVIDQIRTLAATASRIGLGAAFAAALREIGDRLRTDPEAWGDPVRDFPAARLTYYIRYGSLLTVDYAVHVDGTPVFVLSVQPRSGTPLDFAAGSS